MNYAYRLLFIVFLFSSCKSEPELTFSSESFTQKNLEICKDQPCSTVVIDYVKASGDAEISDKINSEIKKHIIEALFLGDDTSPTVKDIPEAATHFILAYRDHQPEFPSELDFESYEAEVTITNPFLNENRASIEIQLYLFTGGAHGYGGTSFINFDVQTGEEISTKDLFINYDEFEAFADLHWTEDEYWNALSAESGIDRLQMEALRAWERDQFSHHLPEQKNQTYYENIGKYNQFNIGWDDALENRVEDSELRESYTFMRKYANDAFELSRTFSTIIILNHIFSALEAAYSTNRANSRFSSAMRLKPMKYEGEYIPALALRVTW